MITYRGERVDGGGMIEGHYVKFPTRNIIRSWGDHCISSLNSSVFYEVHPKSLAIGDTTLRDKTRTEEYPEGKVIFGSFPYEEGRMSHGGDVLKIWEDRTQIFEAVFVGGCLRAGEEYSLSDYKGEFEIIGNAWSNPELLETSDVI